MQNALTVARYAYIRLSLNVDNILNMVSLQHKPVNLLMFKANAR